MDIQHSSKRSKPTNQQPSVMVKKDLLRLQKPLYQLKKSQQNESQYVIRKLMQKKSKPQIGLIGKSPLLSRLKEMMPVFQKSNLDLQNRPILEVQKIDAKLQQCQSSSSQEESDQQHHHGQLLIQKAEDVLNRKLNKMQVQPTHNDEMSNQDDSLGQQLQINFMTYPYLTQQQLLKLQAQKMGIAPSSQAKKVQQKILIQEIPSPQ